MRAQAWFDPRRHDVYARLRERLAEDDGFGVGLDPSRSLVGWAWAASRSSSRGATAWLALADYVSARWSGVPFMSDTIAARTAAWRPAARAWDAPRVDATLGSAGLLPPVLPAGVVVGAMLSGRLRTEGAISDGAVVVAGGHDHPIAGWAVGVMSPGAVLDSMGTAEVVVALSPSPPHGRRDEVDCGPGIGRSGSTLLRVEELARNAEWAARDPEVAEALGALIGGSLAPDDAVHGDGFVPGERGGGRPRYRADVGGNARSRASAVLGALARRGAAAVDAVRAQAGGGGPTFMTGGWTRSAGWAAIKRSVSRAPLHAIREPEVTAVGAALLAARAIAWETEAADVLRPVEVR
jgi:xylulokinase